MRHLAVILTLLVIGTSPSRDRDRVFVGATVYPSPTAPAVPDATVVLHDGRIAAVGPRSSVRSPIGAETVDCSGLFITAGFWNSHVHIVTPGLLHAETATAATLDVELDTMLNRWGFTTAFDLASVLDNTHALQRRIEAGEIRGPHLLTTGEPLWTAPPVYIQDFLAAHHIVIPVVRSSAAAAARVRGLALRHVDGVKLFTGTVLADGVANMPLDMVRAAVAEAHRRRLPVFAHPQNGAGLDAAIDGSVDILAHTAPDSPPWTPAFVTRLVSRRIALIPTLTLFDVEARRARASDRERDEWIARMVEELRAFSSGGGQILFGTDVGYIDHFDTAMEFALMAQAGLSPRQILASLTTSPALRFGAMARAGRVQVGADGDLVVLDEDPMKDPRAFARVRYTVRAGRTTFAAR